MSAPTIHTTEAVALDVLRPHPRNYRTHTDSQLDHLAASIAQHGFYKNVVIAADNTILAGHGAVLAARRLGIETIPAVRLDLDADSPAALKVVAADNELLKFADADDRLLADLLREIGDEDITGLLGTGYDELALAALLLVTRDADEIADYDAAAEWVGMPDYEPPPVTFALIIHFETEAGREDFVTNHFEGSTWKRSPVKWTGYWPARTEPKQSISHRWETADAG